MPQPPRNDEANLDFTATQWSLRHTPRPETGQPPEARLTLSDGAFAALLYFSDAPTKLPATRSGGVRIDSGVSLDMLAPIMAALGAGGAVNVSFMGPQDGPGMLQLLIVSAAG